MNMPFHPNRWCYYSMTSTNTLRYKPKFSRAVFRKFIRKCNSIFWIHCSHNITVTLKRKKQTRFFIDEFVENNCEVYLGMKIAIYGKVRLNFFIIPSPRSAHLCISVKVFKAMLYLLNRYAVFIWSLPQIENVFRWIHVSLLGTWRNRMERNRANAEEVWAQEEDVNWCVVLLQNPCVVLLRILSLLAVSLAL